VLRGLADEDVLDELPGGRFALTRAASACGPGCRARSAGRARDVDDPAAVRMDLHVLVLLHGRERTADE
jgi:hypothetical protein